VTLWLFGRRSRIGSGTELSHLLSCLRRRRLAHARHLQLDLGRSGIGRLGCDCRRARILHAHVSLARIVVLVPILFLPLFFEVPAVVFAGLWFLMQVMQGAADLLMPSAGGVAWWAHIGGFIAGFVLAPRCGCLNAVTVAITPTKACSASIMGPLMFSSK